ncbi:MAG: hypothetical protein H6791_01230 [Candidatus Nomurabacteria bacterium]|nr:MAG: hypothetical protein H6791_01230 [Candidatus Nomurabacteria bacterium]
MFSLVVTLPSSLFADVVSISATVGATTPGGGGGGGGGGGSGGSGGGFSPTGVSFSGRAYPLSTIIILKDGEEVVQTIAGPDALFSVFVGNLTTGTYTFSVLAEDSDGRRSTPFTFPLYITSGVTTYISGIFIAPTIALDKISVKRGDTVSVFGETAPDAEVLINVNSEVPHFFNTASDENGIYLYTFSSAVLEIGSHTAQSQAFLTGEATSYSKSILFNVGSENQAYPTCGSIYDLNGDCRINLIDFSILAYWYYRPSPPSNVDFSGDGIVTIVDFSILAYYWTG